MEPFLPVAIIALVFWLITRLRYVIDDQYVRVMLFGVTLRKVALSDIEFADTKYPFWNEHWCNTIFPWGRSVCLRRKSGLIRNFIITPADRDAFLAELREKLERSRSKQAFRRVSLRRNPIWLRRVGQRRRRSAALRRNPI